jgi:hypothetical protein
MINQVHINGLHHEKVSNFFEIFYFICLSHIIVQDYNVGNKEVVEW